MPATEAPKDAVASRPQEDPQVAADVIGPDLAARMLRSVFVTEIEHLSRTGRASGRSALQFLKIGLTVENVEDLPLDEDGAGLDSLARIHLASTVGNLFGMSSTGTDDYLLLTRTFSEWKTLVLEHLKRSTQSLPLGFKTSGSTGTPTLQKHQLESLIHETQAQIGLLQSLGHRPARVISLTPPHHIYGFIFSGLLPALGTTPVIDRWRHPHAGTVDRLQKGDLVIGTPQDWSRILELRQTFPPEVVGIVSAAPAPPSNWRDSASLGLKSLVEIYGSTETAGIGWRTAPDKPFSLLPHLFADGNRIYNRRTTKPVVVPDRIKWASRESFRVEGRLDRSVQVAGVNVSLDHVRTVLTRHPDILDAAVRPHGERLKAFLVVEDEVLDSHSRRKLLDAAEALANQELSPAARPVHYSFGKTLPRNEMGKLTDWPILRDTFGNPAHD